MQPSGFGGVLHQRLSALNEGDGPLQGDLPSLDDGDPAPRGFAPMVPTVLFQQSNLHADGLKGQAQPLSSAGEPTLIRDNPEAVCWAKVEARHPLKCAVMPVQPQGPIAS
jgi:hypothetical protein